MVIAWYHFKILRSYQQWPRLRNSVCMYKNGLFIMLLSFYLICLNFNSIFLTTFCLSAERKRNKVPVLIVSVGKYSLQNAHCRILGPSSIATDLSTLFMRSAWSTRYCLVVFVYKGHSSIVKSPGALFGSL